MRAFIQIIDDDGVEYEGVIELKSKGAPPRKRQRDKRRSPPVKMSKNPDFKLNARAFMKKYGKDLNGAKKFTMLIAKLASGQVGDEIAVDKAKSSWNSMKAIMGGPYNGAHAVRAKDQGWIDSPKRGIFALAENWTAATQGGGK